MSLRAAALEAPDYASFEKALAGDSCRACGLCRARTHVVVGRGNPAARLLVLGEAPGASEDAEGRAFVGRSGKLLDRWFADAGLDTNRDCLIANVVKCRPPDNRPPTPEEAATCRPLLKKQIELVRPQAVLLMGATAARHVRGPKAGAMRDQVGRFFDSPEYPGARFMALWHPAYLLRDPRKKPLAAKHLTGFVEWWRTAR